MEMKMADQKYWKDKKKIGNMYDNYRLPKITEVIRKYTTVFFCQKRKRTGFQKLRWIIKAIKIEI